MPKELPQDFVRLMHKHYDAATADALCVSLCTTEPDVSIRLNPRKLTADEVLAFHPELEAVPWCPNAFYLPTRPAFTFDPLLHAGAYYVQEAASMFVAEMLLSFKPAAGSLVALDLCAAPGGKSTLTESLLPDGSLVISNEPMPKRAQVLAENMQKWMTGLPAEAPQSLVTNAYPAEFGAMTNCVDVLLTDVPCSGEGMFRKDDGAVLDWSLANVETCQQRQRAILRDIWHALKPGGLLIYSTCTFNRFEDEDNTHWICDELGGELLTERHFLPGRDRGEGFYAAAIRKAGAHEASSGQDIQMIAAKARRTLHLLYDSAQMPEPEGARIELSYQEALQYLRREALRIEAPRGPVTLCYRGMTLGPGKGVGNRINNLYPDPWRIRTTYTVPFCLLGTERQTQNAHDRCGKS